MPLYQIYTDNPDKVIPPLHANSEGEAIGKARQKHRIPDEQNVYAILHNESELTQDTLRVMEVVHAAMMRVYVERQYARLKVTRNVSTTPVTMLSKAYEHMADAYELLSASINEKAG